jgi:hypothetical protein
VGRQPKESPWQVPPIPRLIFSEDDLGTSREQRFSHPHPRVQQKLEESHESSHRIPAADNHLVKDSSSVVYLPVDRLRSMYVCRRSNDSDHCFAADVLSMGGIDIVCNMDT